MFTACQPQLHWRPSTCRGLLLNLFLHLCIFQSQHKNMDVFWVSVCMCVALCMNQVVDSHVVSTSSSSSSSSSLACHLEQYCPLWLFSKKKSGDETSSWRLLLGASIKGRCSEHLQIILATWMLGWLAINCVEWNYKRLPFNFAAWKIAVCVGSLLLAAAAETFNFDSCVTGWWQ